MSAHQMTFLRRQANATVSAREGAVCVGALAAVDRAPDLVERYLAVLDQDDAHLAVIGVLTVRIFGIVGLLMNTTGGTQSIGIKLWESLSEEVRDDVRFSMHGNDMEFRW